MNELFVFLDEYFGVFMLVALVLFAIIYKGGGGGNSDDVNGGGAD